MTTELREELKRKREKELQDLRKVLGSSEGRRVLWRILVKGAIFNSSFAQNANETFFNEGRRSVGLWLTQEVSEADLEKFFQMHREAHSNAKSKPKRDINDD